jgi:GH15 family glucan-1,4-alpha-glucosidase
LLSHEHRVEEAIAAVHEGAVTGSVMMPAQFTLDGQEEGVDDAEDEWPNFQTDCYGLWLWALADHVTRADAVDDTLAAAAELVVGYLLAAGHSPCFDCWEEHPGHVHTSSLAAVAAGLRDAGRLLHNKRQHSAPPN